MKVNEAPEKIHISIRPSEFGGSVLTTVDKDFSNSVEYTRTDAFIEKACNAYCKVCKMTNCRSNECKFINNFKGYLQTI